MDPELVDRIYECAFMPDEWPSALGELAAIATARTGYSSPLRRASELPLVAGIVQVGVVASAALA